MENIKSELLTRSEPIIYTIKGKQFVVEPVFIESGNRTLGAALLEMIQRDIKNS